MRLPYERTDTGMNLKFHAIQIDPQNPFEKDLLNRSEEIINLSKLLLNVNSPAVIAIDSRWGTGKTTFIKMWRHYLKNEGLESLCFNAWETDYAEDSLVSFLGEINEELEALIGTSQESKQAWDKTKAIGKQLAKRGIPAIIKIATAGVIDAEKLVEDEISKLTASLAGDAIDNYLKQKNAVDLFHKELTKLISSSTNTNPVVIFVDELDRCRPSYAISLLERIKHLFNIEGLVFVLALDKTQLGHSISAVYGTGIDSKGYLRRFIDFEYQLRNPRIKEYIDFLFTALSFHEYFEPRKKYSELQYDRDHLFNTFLLLAECHELSLREIEQLLASINLALRTARENEYIHPALLTFLIVTKNLHPDQFQQYISAESEVETIEYLYQIVPEKIRIESFECALIEGFLIAAKNERFKLGGSASLIRHKEILTNSDLQNEAKRYSETVLNVVNRPVGMGGSVDLKTLIKRINFLSQFVF